MDTAIYPPGTLVVINRDSRFKESDTAAVVLDNRTHPLYQVRLGNNQFDHKSPAYMVAASKLSKV